MSESWITPCPIRPAIPAHQLHMPMKVFSLLLAAVTSIATAFAAAERPNILWIVSEDNSYQWIGCYGNPQAQTPRINALAKDGILFEHAYSNAPVCAVARSTLLMGTYAVTMGTQHMRSRHPIPARYRPYVEYLRHAGYYCTNNAKTDYNFEGKDTSWWDESSTKAHYSHRPAGSPFFAVFNLGVSHESSLFENQPGPKRLSPAEIKLPPYVPDLPEMRVDFARYHDRITEMDRQVGVLIDELTKAGLADDTIVIYNADHGGVTPRGKRYLYETGVRIPFVMHIPAKWRNLAPFSPGQRVQEPVSFVDFLPTFLSLAGIPLPANLQGRAFLGSQRQEPASDEMEFLYADRFDELYGMRRGLTDGKWKYMRCFTPYLPAAPYSFYPYNVPSWVAWQKAWKAGKLTGIHRQFWESTQAPEELYDLSKDPWEVHNLANDPAFQGKLVALRERLKRTMRAATDTGLVPEPLFSRVAAGSTVADYVQSSRFNYDGILDLAFAATQRDAKALPKLAGALSSKDPIARYWALCGMAVLGNSAAGEADAIKPLLADPTSINRTAAGLALWEIGDHSLAKRSLLADVAGTSNSWDLLYLLNTLHALNLTRDLPKGWEQGKEGRKDNLDYIHRFALRITKETVN